jgi:dTDP-4-amino-4,6-dideoxygalactose transaminase
MEVCTNHPILKISPNSEKFADCLLRLPLYPDLTQMEQNYIISKIKEFYVEDIYGFHPQINRNHF